MPQNHPELAERLQSFNQRVEHGYRPHLKPRTQNLLIVSEPRYQLRAVAQACICKPVFEMETDEGLELG